MKNIFLLLAIVLFVVAVSPAQVYVRAGGGYGVGYGARTSGVFIKTFSTQTPPSQFDVEGIVDQSFGRGGVFDCNIGMKFSKSLMGEIGVGYVAGKSFAGETTSNVLSYPFTMKSHMLAITPSLLITANEFGNTNLFARIGAIAAFPGLKVEQSSSTTEFSGPIAWGFSAGTGMMIPILDNLQIVPEVSFTNLSWAPDKATITPASGAPQTVVNFQESQTSNDFPAVSPARSYPFGQIGLSVNLLYTL